MVPHPRKKNIMNKAEVILEEEEEGQEEITGNGKIQDNNKEKTQLQNPGQIQIDNKT
jgi:hypothetical protein